MADLVYRTYHSSDHEQVMLLHKEALLHTNAYTGEGSWDDDLLDIENHYLNNNGWFVVGETDGKLVTMGAFRRVENHVAEIKRMRTRPHMQGKGIGKKVLNLLLERIKEYGYSEVILETSNRQIAAEKIYLAAGFIPYKSENIRGLDCTWYKMPISK